MKFSIKVPIPFSNSFIGKKFIEPTLYKALFQDFGIYPLDGRGRTQTKKALNSWYLHLGTNLRIAV